MEDLKFIELDKLRTSERNPRMISEFMLEKLSESLLVSPFLSKLRPIVANSEFEVLGGNQRLEAYRKIAVMSQRKLAESLENQLKFKFLDTSQQEKLIEKWTDWQKTRFVPVKIAEVFTPQQEKEFMVKDNLSFGEDDVEIIRNNYDVDLIESYTGKVNLSVFDYSEKINDEGIERVPIKIIILKCGFVESILTDTEFAWFEDMFLQYRKDNGTTDGFIKFLLS